VLKRVALGLRAHSGWAALVAIGGAADIPVVIQRRRLELADCRIASAKLPYHAAEPMELKAAEKFLRGCAQATRAMAEPALRGAVADLHGKGLTVIGACVLLASGRPLPDLAATLASHALIHTAEGEFYRDALRKACECCGLAVTGIKERELLNQASQRLGLSPNELGRRVSELGKGIGPPWTQDEKLCAMAGWVTLAGGLSG